MQPPFPIYLLRHGQTEWNAIQRVQGTLDSPLTATGVEQARAMAVALDRLCDPAVAWDLVASPVGRAACTAGIIAGKTGLSLRFDERLREIGLGSWDGLMVADIKMAQPEITSKPGWNFFSDGESYDDVAARTGSWLQSVDRPTIAVSHGVAGYVIRGLYLGEPYVPHQSTHTSQDGLYLLDNGQIHFIECA